MNLSQLTLFLIGLMVIIFTVNSCDNQITQPEEEPVSDETTFIPFNPNSQSGGDISRNKTVSAKAPSQFGCSLSTLNPQNEDELYRHQAFFIRFPEKVMDGAGGNVTHRSFALRSDRAEERMPEFLNKKGVVRFLTCRIPDSPGALQILEVEMQKFGDQSWYTDVDASEKTRQKGGEWVCQYVPGDGYGNISSSITIEGITYTTYYFHEECDFVWENEPVDELIEDPFGGTGGSGSSGGGNSGDIGSGSSPDPCPSLEGTAVTYIADESDESLGCGLDEVMEPLNLEDDIVMSLFDPDCDKSVSEQAPGISERDYKIWCNSEEPEGIYLERTNIALDNIRQRGAICESIANFGESLLNEGRFRYFPRSAWSKSGGIGGSFANGGPMIAIMEDYVEKFHNETFTVSGVKSDNSMYSHQINFEWAIVHELEHAMGEGHVNSDPYLTPNVQQCSGLN